MLIYFVLIAWSFEGLVVFLLHENRPRKTFKRAINPAILDAESRAADQEKIAQKQEQAIQKQEQEVMWLSHQVAQLRRMLFGSKRERFEGDKNQVKIAFEDYASEQQKQDETPVKEKITYERSKPKKHAGRNRIPDEDVSGMKKIGEERTEILEHIPERFFKLVIIRPKYARMEKFQDLSLHSEVKNVVIADLPSRPIEKCLAGNSLLAALIINKYIDHLKIEKK